MNTSVDLHRSLAHRCVLPQREWRFLKISLRAVVTFRVKQWKERETFVRNKLFEKRHNYSLYEMLSLLKTFYIDMLRRRWRVQFCSEDRKILNAPASHPF